MSTPLDELLAQPDEVGPLSADTVQRLLHAVRTQLGMEVAWTSEFIGQEQVFRFVDADPGASAPLAGTRLPMSGSFCARVLDGRVPALIPDARRDPATALLEVTRELQLGSYLGVPLVAADGIVTGMLCAASRLPTPGLAERELATLRLLAHLLHDLQLRALADAAVLRAAAQLRHELEQAVLGIGRWAVLQPIVDVASEQVVAYEGLSRFDGLRTPAQWFDAAARAGLGTQIELAAARSVLALLAGGAVPAGAAVTVNLSPPTLVTADLGLLLDGLPLDRVVLEVTEHAPVGDYERLRAVLDPWRRRGVRLAVDDAGAGYASLQHVLLLSPDLVKLDMLLVRGLDSDPVRRALLGAVVAFACDHGMQVVAEGVETAAERDTLVDIGVRLVQGFFVGRPARP